METMTTETTTEATTATTVPSRFESGSALILAGIRENYTFENRTEIPKLWNRFGPRIDTVPDKAGNDAYGVLISTPDGKGFDYMAAVAVSGTENLPTDLTTREIPAQKYAIFPHPGHVSTLCETIDGIFQKWLPQSGQELTVNPDFFEKYGPGFDPATGSGDMEVWVPVKG
jgi:AraC family transcriptional regulator